MKYFILSMLLTSSFCMAEGNGPKPYYQPIEDHFIGPTGISAPISIPFGPNGPHFFGENNE
jgi:hypothetical protein